jgi:hypothetical protein
MGRGVLECLTWRITPILHHSIIPVAGIDYEHGLDTLLEALAPNPPREIHVDLPEVPSISSLISNFGWEFAL